MCGIAAGLFLCLWLTYVWQVLKLSWRDEATKICVLVSDAPPHGLQASGDSFPNGCPSGHDPLSIARQLAEKGITLYVAGCEPSLVPYKDFFAALAYVTGGQYVPLSAAGALTAVIVGGAQEELSMEQWMEQVGAYYFHLSSECTACVLKAKQPINLPKQNNKQQRRSTVLY